MLFSTAFGQRNDTAQMTETKRKIQFSIAWAPLALLVIGGTLGLFMRYYEVKAAHGPDFSAIPMEFADYVGSERRFPESTYSILKADTTTLRRYQDLQGNVYWLFIAYFKEQKYGSQIHSPKQCLPGGGWRIDSIDPYSLTLSAGLTQPVNVLTIGRRNTKQVMFYWFETRSGAIRGEFALKFDLVKNALVFRPTDASFVRLTVENVGGNTQEARELGAKFLLELDIPLKTALPFETTSS